MKNILFPTDMSEAAQKAFVYALQLADNQGASITTLLVFKKPIIKGAHLPSTMEEFYATYDLTEFQNYKDSIPPLHDLIKSEGYEHLDVKHAMEEGETIETILRVAKENECDLIVMGTTGAKGLKELFMGSVAGEILENAHCPVLVVPDSSTFDGKIDQIAFTTSYKEEEKKALQKLTEIAADFDAEIHCINVDIAHTSELTNQMAAFKADVQGYDKMTFEVLEGNDVKKAIFDYLAANPIDIIAMVTHKRNFFEELFNFSKTKRLAYHSKTPLLAIPAELLG
jgi:nucleotide-binding universal stress UspA family protein